MCCASLASPRMSLSGNQPIIITIYFIVNRTFFIHHKEHQEYALQ